MGPALIRVDIPHLRLTNPMNGSQGRSRGGGIARSRARKVVREAVHAHVLAALGRRSLPPTSAVTITRIAPRELDAHDGLPASCKAVVDGVASAMGLKDDKHLRVTYRQERGAARQYAVRIDIG